MLVQIEYEIWGYKCIVYVNQLQDVVIEWVMLYQIKEMLLIINIDGLCYLVLGGLYQVCGGMVCYDVVVWGYVCVCFVMGMDIIQNCEVIGVEIENGQVCVVNIGKGWIECDKLVMIVVGYFLVLVEMVGFCLLIELLVLQVLVFELIKFCCDLVIMVNIVYGYLL